MGRPRKEERDRRTRWAVLNVTQEERETIEAFAREAGLSTCEYIVRRACQRPVSPRQDWQQLVRQQARILRQLDEIAAALVLSEPIRDAGAALLVLRRIEAELSSWGSGSGPAPSREDLAAEDPGRKNADSGDERAEC